MMQQFSAKDLARYREHAAEREAERQRTLQERKERARVAAQRAAHILKRDYHATRVVLFGSLAHGAWWHENSDVDLAAEGIPPELFWRAWGAVEGLAPGIQISLAPLETVKESLRKHILEEGTEL